MIRAIKYAVALLLVALMGVLGLAAIRPDSFAVVRHTVIHAPPQKIYPLLADFHAWKRWSPWEGRDPGLKREFSGAEQGVGAVYAWQGNRAVGKGRMEISEAVPSSRVAVKLDFEEPMQASDMAVFTLTPKGEETDVEWVMTGEEPFAGKIFGLFVDIDRLIGQDFEKGLAAIKTEAEGGKA